jgi:hypothetical protein
MGGEILKNEMPKTKNEAASYIASVYISEGIKVNMQ